MSKLEKVITVNQDTGEILDTKHVYDGDRVDVTVKSPKQQEYTNNHVLRFNKGMPFGKLYVGGMMKHIEEELKPAEWMFFCRLLDFVCYDDCILRPYGDRRFTKEVCGISNQVDVED